MKQSIAVAVIARAALVESQGRFDVPSTTSPGNDVFDGFMSYSIEFSSFPDFAGNKSHPNTFSGILLENLAAVTGSKPYIRVGGNTQDYALYNASLPYALNGTYDLNRSPDYPTTIFIGPSYFESYDTWEDVKFSHGLNFGLGGNNSAGWQTLLDSVPLVCRALGGKLYAWQYGNEPDLFSTSSHGIVRPPSWNEEIYVEQWRNGTRAIDSLIDENCPELRSFGYLAPAFAGLGNKLKAPAAWKAGLSSEASIKLFSTHNYMSGAESPGVTLQGTLMNHTNVKRAIKAHVDEYLAILSSDQSAPPPIFGEHNSLYNQGRPGLSNAFGAALWGLDFNLYAASQGFKRVHMHQGTDYRYASWQPTATPNTTLGTKAPYYGNIALAASLAGSGRLPVTVTHIPLEENTFQRESAYAIHVNNGTALAGIVVLNMHSYNTTVNGTGITPVASPPARGDLRFTFNIVPSTTDPGTKPDAGTAVRVQRLLAAGSDAISGITWDGWSYNYELEGGRPVRLGNVTIGETIFVDEDGSVTVTVPHSSAVLLSFPSEGEGGGEYRAREKKRWPTEHPEERRKTDLFGRSDGAGSENEEGGVLEAGAVCDL